MKLVRHSPWLGLVALHLIAFSVSAHISTQHHETRIPGSVMETALGESRLVLSRYCYDKADQYLHAGVPHLRTTAFSSSLYQDLLRHTSPEKHLHIHGADVEEIIPWLWLALQSDPHNLELYLNAAFWIEREAGRPDVAMRILTEAQCMIHFNECIQLEKGRIALRLGELSDAAAAFDAGIRFCAMADNKTEPLVHARLLLYRALIHEAKGERDQAIGLLEQYSRILPKDDNIRARITELRSNNAPALMASSFWQRILTQEDTQRGTCTKEDHSSPHDQDEPCDHPAHKKQQAKQDQYGSACKHDQH